MTGPEGDPMATNSPTPRRLPPELDPRRPVTKPVRSPRTPSPRQPKSGSGGGRPPRTGGGRFSHWSRRRFFTTMTAGSLAVLMVAGGATAAILGKRILDSIPRAKCPTCISSPDGKGLNFLIMGSDSRAGLTDEQKLALHVGHAAGQRSDTMILMHIPENGGKAEMVSLPRDSYVTIPAHCPGGNPPSKQNTCPKGASVIPAAPNKLNAAYSFGGPTLAVATVEANTHVPIDHYIVINFSGFVNMVDKLGGVPICSPTAIHDPVVRDAAGNYSGSGLELNAGTTTLHGPEALEYVRAREFDPSQGDLGRIQRQQKFMGALLNKAESAGVILDLPKLYSFLKAVTASLKVDSGLTNGTILGLAKRLHSLSPKNVDLLTVPLSDTNYASSVGFGGAVGSDLVQGALPRLQGRHVGEQRHRQAEQEDHRRAGRYRAQRAQCNGDERSGRGGRTGADQRRLPVAKHRKCTKAGPTRPVLSCSTDRLGLTPHKPFTRRCLARRSRRTSRSATPSSSSSGPTTQASAR